MGPKGLRQILALSLGGRCSGNQDAPAVAAITASTLVTSPLSPGQLFVPLGPVTLLHWDGGGKL